MTTNDHKQHLRFHNLSILKISQSYSVLSKTDQLLDHPIGYFYKTDLGQGLNLPELDWSGRNLLLPIEHLFWIRFHQSAKWPFVYKCINFALRFNSSFSFRFLNLLFLVC